MTTQCFNLLVDSIPPKEFMKGGQLIGEETAVGAFYLDFKVEADEMEEAIQTTVDGILEAGVHVLSIM